MNLFFRRFGQGFPVIILHGLFGISDNWVSFGRALAGHYEVFIPDLRNHGQSPHSRVFDLPSLAMDLDEFIQEHQLIHPAVIGHSLGGKTAMHYAIEHPDSIGKLVVVDISPRAYPPNSEHRQLIDAMLRVNFNLSHSRMDVDRQLEPMVPDQKLRQFLLKNVYWRNATTLDWRLNLAALNENLPSVFEGVDPDGSFLGPTLFIRGEKSRYIGERDYPLIEKKFPQASVVTIPHASHWVHADAPAEFFRIVFGFLMNS